MDRPPAKVPPYWRLLGPVLKVFFKLLYGRMAWTYDLVAAGVSLGRWDEWVRTILSELPGPRVLELGHGPGHLQAALGQKGILAFGLDASPQMGRQAYQRLKKIGLQPRLVQGYAQNVPFRNQAFDQVAATFPTEYIAHPETMAEIYRTLNPGGKLVIVPGAWITGASLPDRLAAALFRITGQSPAWSDRMGAPFRKAGFALDVRMVELPTSTVLLIIATRSG